jgi:hypothetical protein
MHHQLLAQLLPKQHQVCLLQQCAVPLHPGSSEPAGTLRWLQPADPCCCCCMQQFLCLTPHVLLLLPLLPPALQEPSSC